MVIKTQKAKRGSRSHARLQPFGFQLPKAAVKRYKRTSLTAFEQTPILPHMVQPAERRNPMLTACGSYAYSTRLSDSPTTSIMISGVCASAVSCARSSYDAISLCAPVLFRLQYYRFSISGVPFFN